MPNQWRLVVGYVKYRFMGVYHFPKEHCIYIDRDRIFGKGLFCFEGSRDHASVNPIGHSFNDRDDKKQSGSLHSSKFT